MFLQYLSSILTLSLPNHTAFSIHDKHSVEFQFNEYVPAIHGLHVELFIIASPGRQNLNDTVMVLFVGRSRYDVLSESIKLQLARYSVLIAPG